MTNQNTLRGLFLAAISLFFLIQAPRYSIGTLITPEPDFFPAAVAGLLLILSLAILVRSFLVQPVKFEVRLRNVGLVLCSLISFALLTQYVNMIVGTVVMTVIASLASADFSIKRSLVIATILCFIAVAMKHGLGVHLPLY